MKKILLAVIKGYQWIMNGLRAAQVPFVPAYTTCKFHPNCSEYAIQAIDQYGIIKGVPAAFYRIMRCNPWSNGGIDLP